jgi:hypothetical protein
MTMLGTAEIVADRYEISREAQDVYALRSQQRTAAALAAGRFDAEIAPIATTMTVVDKASGATSQKQVRLAKDEGARADTTLEGLASLNPVFADGMRVKVGRNITAGNASQLSDGASACVIMEAKEAERRGLQPLGIYRGIAVALQPRRNGHRSRVRHTQTAEGARIEGDQLAGPISSSNVRQSHGWMRLHTWGSISASTAMQLVAPAIRGLTSISGYSWTRSAASQPEATMVLTKAGMSTGALPRKPANRR